MKVNPLKTIVTENGVHLPGVIFEIDEKEGKRLLEMGVVTLVAIKEPKKKEMKDV